MLGRTFLTSFVGRLFQHELAAEECEGEIFNTIFLLLQFEWNGVILAVDRNLTLSRHLNLTRFCFFLRRIIRIVDSELDGLFKLIHRCSECEVQITITPVSTPIEIKLGCTVNRRHYRC